MRPPPFIFIPLITLLIHSFTRMLAFIHNFILILPGRPGQFTFKFMKFTGWRIVPLAVRDSFLYSRFISCTLGNIPLPLLSIHSFFICSRLSWDLEIRLRGASFRLFSLNSSALVYNFIINDSCNSNIWIHLVQLVFCLICFFFAFNSLYLFPIHLHKQTSLTNLVSINDSADSHNLWPLLMYSISRCA